MFANEEAVMIGSTILLVQRREAPAALKRLLPHGTFEARLIEECARAENLRACFALLRLRCAD